MFKKKIKNISERDVEIYRGWRGGGAEGTW